MSNTEDLRTPLSIIEPILYRFLMLKISELAMPKSHTVTTVCNDRLWSDYEQAKTYFLEIMMSTDGEEHDRAECVYIQLMHGLDECSDED